MRGERGRGREREREKEGRREKERHGTHIINICNGEAALLVHR